MVAHLLEDPDLDFDLLHIVLELVATFQARSVLIVEICVFRIFLQNPLCAHDDISHVARHVAGLELLSGGKE